MGTILIIEDEVDLAELLAFNLEQEGHVTRCVHNGVTGLEWAVRECPDLILLDLMIPGMLGIDVCKALRKDPRTVSIPVIMITAKGDEIDRVVGFEVGADDYIVKPFSMREVILRVKSMLKRQMSVAPVRQPELLKIGTISIDIQRYIVTSEGSVVDLTTTEFKLLLHMLEHKGYVLSREQLLQRVWGYNNVGDTRTVDTHVTRLRNKLGLQGEMIKTVRGFGYKIEV